MPELPEVETIRRQLEPQLVGRDIVAADSHPSEKFTPALDVVGATITSVGRRGKYLLVGTGDDRELVIHLGMTGSLAVADRPPPRWPDPDEPHLRAWWGLDGSGGRWLTFHDTRRFGRLRVVPAGDHGAIPTLAAAGPEPFDPALDGRELWRRIRTSRRRIKTQLLSQRPVAGVGNIYADEALWLAAINPSATRLSVDRASRLLEAIRTVLRQGIDNGGTTLRDYRDAEGGTGTNQAALQAYGRRGEPCRRCGTALRSAVLDARSTTWCPRCQRR